LPAPASRFSCCLRNVPIVSSSSVIFRAVPCPRRGVFDARASQGAMRATAAEVIVVDEGSTDATPRLWTRRRRDRAHERLA
jgi:hypothetical protein